MTELSFEHFDQGAIAAVELAQQEAAAMNHCLVGTEMLVLGLIRQDAGDAAVVLKSLGVTLERAREAVRAIVGEGIEVKGAEGAFTPRALQVLTRAVYVSEKLQSTLVGTGHLLLGILYYDKSASKHLLQSLGVNPHECQFSLYRQI